MIGRIAVVVAVLWSLLCLAAYGLLNWVGDAAIRNADVVPVDPEGVVFLSRALGVLQGLGFGAIIIVWLVGTALVFGVAVLIRRFAPGR